MYCSKSKKSRSRKVQLRMTQQRRSYQVLDQRIAMMKIPRYCHSFSIMYIKANVLFNVHT